MSDWFHHMGFSLPGVPDLQASLGASPLHDDQHMSGKVTLHHQADTCLAKKNTDFHIVLNRVSALCRPAPKAPPFQDKSLTWYPEADL